ncbi:alpha/beta hydrolase [Glaciibacter psychrotolerans]|uniref:Acetyl esterase/lipase n=1 Tax=Glaciibacter psychrotolerans TaxID=670054 RepID=A0A7Z0J6T9_9MICO|nr:alpha/beta hydrolase [Leifsonia psychrotolerans]NYJ20902.1 acetyl esterase/lipase [Leifsonia psychrotolerans]
MSEMLRVRRPARTTFRQSSSLRGLSRVPVWVWKALMMRLTPAEVHKFNVEPIDTVDYHFDIDYVGEGMRDQRLDVLVPHGFDEPLPVYIYFHGGGWTSGDKAPLTKYCASQARDGMVVVNVNYRMATEYLLKDMLDDGNSVLDWVKRNITAFGGDASRIVLGGDSAGGHISALLAAATFDSDLAAHYDIHPHIERDHLRGLVQHCSMPDFSVIFERGFILSQNFMRMLLPGRGRGQSLKKASRFLNPIEWLDKGFPPVFLTTSERDFFYEANLNFVEALRRRALPVDTLIYSRDRVNTKHTWQQDAKHPESQEVYRRLGAFVRNVAAVASATTTAVGIVQADDLSARAAGPTRLPPQIPMLKAPAVPLSALAAA